MMSAGCVGSVPGLRGEGKGQQRERERDGR